MVAPICRKNEQPISINESKAEELQCVKSQDFYVAVQSETFVPQSRGCGGAGPGGPLVRSATELDPSCAPPYDPYGPPFREALPTWVVGAFLLFVTNAMLRRAPVVAAGIIAISVYNPQPKGSIYLGQQGSGASVD